MRARTLALLLLLLLMVTSGTPASGIPSRGGDGLVHESGLFAAGLAYEIEGREIRLTCEFHVRSDRIVPLFRWPPMAEFEVSLSPEAEVEQRSPPGPQFGSGNNPVTFESVFLLPEDHSIRSLTVRVTFEYGETVVRAIPGGTTPGLPAQTRERKDTLEFVFERTARRVS